MTEPKDELLVVANCMDGSEGCTLTKHVQETPLQVVGLRQPAAKGAQMQGGVHIEKYGFW